MSTPNPAQIVTVHAVSVPIVENPWQELPIEKLPDDPLKRLESLESILLDGTKLIRQGMSASIGVGLALIQIETERLFRMRTVKVSSDETRPMTLSEYSTYISQNGARVSVSTLSRAKRAAEVFLTLRRDGCDVTLQRAHYMPLLEAEPSHIVAIYTSAIRKYGTELTEQKVQDEVCDFYGRDSQKKESTYSRLKSDVNILAGRALASLEAGKTEECRVDLQALIERAGGVAKPKSKKPKKTEPVENPPGGAKKDEPKGEPLDKPDPPKPKPQGEPVGAQKEQKPPTEKAEHRFGTTVFIIDATEMRARHENFDRKNPPATDKVLRDAGFTFQDGWLRFKTTPGTRAEDVSKLLAALENAAKAKAA